jgi:hypothetical protein
MLLQVEKTSTSDMVEMIPGDVGTAITDTIVNPSG